jgi:hypothetical protein
MTRKTTQQYGPKEAEQRFEAALHGAFKTPAIPLKSISPKPRKIKKRRSKASA